METHYLWVGVWNQAYTDENRREVVRIVGEQIGEWEARYGEYRGITYRAYRTANSTVLIHQYEWSTRFGDDHRAAIFEYGSLEEAAGDGFRQALENMRKYAK